MNRLMRKLLPTLSMIGFMLNTLNVNAVSISTKRLYLAPQTKSAAIYVVNIENKTQSCNLSLKDAVISDNSIIHPAPKGKTIANSATKLVRFAPRRFELGPNQHQNIKLSFRRRPGLNNGEYKGLFSIRCQTDNGDTADGKAKMVSIKPSLVLNVPLIVHTGNLKASAAFESVKLTTQQVEVTMSITGNRAITGDLELVEKKSGEIIAVKKDMSIYWESPRKHVILPITKNVTSALYIRFRENPKFGGNLLITQQVN